LETVDRFCLLVSQDERLKRPEFNELRQQLLQMAVEFDKEFVGVPDVADDAKLQSAVAYVRLGSLGSGNETLNESLEYLSLGREFLVDLLESNPDNSEYALELVRCERELGKIHSRMGDAKKSQEFLHSSINQADQLIDRNQRLADSNFEKAKSLTALGTLYLKSSQRTDAEAPLLQSIELLEQLQRELPEDWSLKIALANSYQRLGQFYVSVIRFWRKAEIPYQQAADIFEAAYAAEPDSSDLAANLATTYHAQARWSFMDNHLTRAITLLEKARDILTPVAARHENILGYQVELSRTIRDLALYYSRLDALDPRVIELSERTETILSNLIAHDPLDTSYQGDLASSLLNHAEALKSHQQFEDALAKVNSAVERLQALLDLDPQDSFALEKLQFAFASRAALYGELGDFASALQDWDRAIEFAPLPFKSYNRMQQARTLVSSGKVVEGTRVAESILAEIDASDSGQYQTVGVAAQVFALAAAKAQAEPPDPELISMSAGFADKAMELIRTRSQLAPMTAVYLETTRDFDGIRARKDFDEILDNLRSPPDN
jgi:tetratricopeptide (TPR) repeat protein